MTLIVFPKLEIKNSGISSVGAEDKSDHTETMEMDFSDENGVSHEKLSYWGLVADLINGGWMDAFWNKDLQPWRAVPPVVLVVSWGTCDASLVKAFSSRDYKVCVQTEDALVYSPAKFGAADKDSGVSLVIAVGIPETISPERAKRLFRKISRCSSPGALVALSYKAQPLSRSGTLFKKDKTDASVNFIEVAESFGFHQKSSFMSFFGAAKACGPTVCMERLILEAPPKRPGTWGDGHLASLRV